MSEKKEMPWPIRDICSHCFVPYSKCQCGEWHSEMTAMIPEKEAQELWELKQSSSYWKMVHHGAKEVEQWSPNQRASVCLSKVEDRKKSLTLIENALESIRHELDNAEYNDAMDICILALEKLSELR